jgi:hypothetical protein
MRRAEPKDDSRDDDDLMAWNMERLVALANMIEAEAMVLKNNLSNSSNSESECCVQHCTYNSAA